MNFKKAIVYTCTFASLIGLVGEVQGKVPDKSRLNIQHDYNNDYDYGYNDFKNTRPIRLNAQVNRRFTGSSTIKLRQVLNMDNNYRGYKLTKIILVAQTDAGRGHATLVVNGRSVQRERVARHSSRVTFSPNPNEDIIGQEIRNMEIQLNGIFDVTKVTAVLEKSRTSGHDNGRIDHRQLAKRVNISVYANSLLKLSNILNADHRQSQQRVNTVIMDVQAGVRGEVEICNNDYYRTCTRGQMVRGTQQLRFNLHQSDTLGKLMVKTQGNMNIKMVKVLF